MSEYNKAVHIYIRLIVMKGLPLAYVEDLKYEMSLATKSPSAKSLQEIIFKQSSIDFR